MTAKTDASLGIPPAMAEELDAQTCAGCGWAFRHTALDHVRVAMAHLAGSAEDN